MARAQTRSKLKVSGGRYRPSRGKKKYELSGFPATTKLADEKRKRVKRVLGSNVKTSLLQVKEVNVLDKKGKATKTEIINVVENVANPNLVRRNVLTKGAIVETKLGRARITSRPGQEGGVNAVLV
ncbi:30S ribosomal protein S8e [Candidatus Woesearchaeota archaeon CG10_big_fil_rev_8_21_14_0_10_45_16]|nr:MAG: 30S ribosomal protein S8e [Candidatus Woesearchaeota archaeon CG10_big_fil_rev_8_21_14_0_10_45_16]